MKGAQLRLILISGILLGHVGFAYAVPIDPVEKYDIQWVKTPDLSRKDIAAAAHRIIKAPARIVWELIRNPDNYDHLSNHLIQAKARVMGDEQPISFDIELGGLWNLLEHSDEIIHPFDEELMTVGWIRKVSVLPCTKGYKNDPNHWKENYSQRYQLVEAIDANTSHYFTALKIPGFAGRFAKKHMGARIQKAFDTLADGILRQAESIHR